MYGDGGSLEKWGCFVAHEWLLGPCRLAPLGGSRLENEPLLCNFLSGWRGWARGAAEPPAEVRLPPLLCSRPRSEGPSSGPDPNLSLTAWLRSLEP